MSAAWRQVVRVWRVRRRAIRQAGLTVADVREQNLRGTVRQRIGRRRVAPQNTLPRRILRQRSILPAGEEVAAMQRNHRPVRIYPGLTGCVVNLHRAGVRRHRQIVRHGAVH